MAPGGIGAQRLPDALLERRAANVERQVEARAGSSTNPTTWATSRS